MGGLRIPASPSVLRDVIPHPLRDRRNQRVNDSGFPCHAHHDSAGMRVAHEVILSILLHGAEVGKHSVGELDANNCGDRLGAERKEFGLLIAVNSVKSGCLTRTSPRHDAHNLRGRRPSKPRKCTENAQVGNTSAFLPGIKSP